MKVNNKHTDNGIEVWDDCIISIGELNTIGSNAQSVLNLAELIRHYAEQGDMDGINRCYRRLKERSRNIHNAIVNVEY